MVTIDRVQTGMRLEVRTVKVLKALAEYLDMSLGDIVEGIVWHAFDGTTPFSDATLEAVARLREVYGLELSAADAHRFPEEEK